MGIYQVNDNIYGIKCIKLIGDKNSDTFDKNIVFELKYDNINKNNDSIRIEHDNSKILMECRKIYNSLDETQKYVLFIYYRFVTSYNDDDKPYYEWQRITKNDFFKLE